MENSLLLNCPHGGFTFKTKSFTMPELIRESYCKEVQVPGIMNLSMVKLQTTKLVIFSGDHVYLRLWSGIRIFTATFLFYFLRILREDFFMACCLSFWIFWVVWITWNQIIFFFLFCWRQTIPVFGNRKNDAENIQKNYISWGIQGADNKLGQFLRQDI